MQYLKYGDSSRKMFKYDFYWGWYQLTSGAIANVVRRDLLRLKYIFDMCISQSVTFIEVDIFHRMVPLRM